MITPFSVVGVHQFCQVGAHVMIGTGSSVLQDVPAYLMVSGNKAEPHGINVEGLRRRGFSQAAVQNLRKAYKLLYRQGLRVEEALQQMQPLAADTPEVQLLIDSVRHSSRGIIR